MRAQAAEASGHVREGGMREIIARTFLAPPSTTREGEAQAAHSAGRNPSTQQ